MTPSYASLVERFRQPLPGETAHALMYPRKGVSPDLLKVTQDARMSAVAILLFEGDNCLNSVVIQRTVYDGSHSGQIAFPGGKWETSDASMLETALRECQEEIGVTADELNYIGKLTDVFTAVSSFLIEPHVFYWKTPRTDFTLSEREVAAVHTIDLCELQDDANIVHLDVPIQNGVVLKSVPHFVVNDIRIWGATALMLSELRLVLRSVRNGNGQIRKL